MESLWCLQGNHVYRLWTTSDYNIYSFLVTNVSNHWILRQLTRSTKIDPWPGVEVLFVATNDRLPSHPAKKQVGEPQSFLVVIIISEWPTVKNNKHL